MIILPLELPFDCEHTGISDEFFIFHAVKRVPDAFEQIPVISAFDDVRSVFHIRCPSRCCHEGVGVRCCAQGNNRSQKQKNNCFFHKISFLIKNKTTVLMNATEPMQLESAAKT